MKVAVLVGALLVSFQFISAQQQIQDIPQGARASGEQLVLLNGKVTTEANSAPAESVTIVLDCIGSHSVQTDSDPNGSFSIRVYRPVHSLSDSFSEIDQRKDQPPDLGGCDITAKLHGYTSEPLHLATCGNAVGAIDVGTIILHSTSKDQAFAVSVSSLAAPEKAKAAFEKGEEQKKKGKWTAAVESFRKAIAAYPRYALAWLELGRVQATQHNFTDAQQSFRESIAQDSKLVDGYIELARLAAEQSQWPDLLSATEHLLQVHPETAEFWFWNSAANFNLGNMKEAQASVTKGLSIDSSHRVPQMEYLYALVLARLQDFQSAADHVAAYLKLSPQANDAPEAQKRLAQFQKLATVAGTR